MKYINSLKNRVFNWGFTLRTTQKPQLILRFYRILQADLVPFADAIGAVRNNRYYVHFVHYKSAWVYHEKGKSS